MNSFFLPTLSPPNSLVAALLAGAVCRYKRWSELRRRQMSVMAARRPCSHQGDGMSFDGCKPACKSKSAAKAAHHKQLHMSSSAVHTASVLKVGAKPSHTCCRKGQGPALKVNLMAIASYYSLHVCCKMPGSSRRAAGESYLCPGTPVTKLLQDITQLVEVNRA